jgi:hypothetical protein
MKVSFSYPMLGNGRAKQGRTNKVGVVVGEWTLDALEVAAGEAPVAFYVCPDGKETYAIRWHDGMLYRKFPVNEGGAVEAEGGLLVKGITRRLERLLGNALQNDITRGASRQGYHPEGIAAAAVVNALQNGDIPLKEDWSRPDGSFVFDDAGLIEAERWRELAEEAAGCLLAIDGTLWERCEEPIYKIATRASPGVDVLGGRPIAAMNNISFISYTYADHRLFSALEHDLALDAKAKSEPYRKVGLKEVSDYIEVFIPQAVSYQSADGELRRLVRLLIEDVEREIAMTARTGNPKWSDRLPVPLIETWTDVRKAEVGLDLPGGHDRAEEAVLKLVALMRPFDARKQGSLRDEDVDELLSRWQDREIALESVRYGSAMNL